MVKVRKNIMVKIKTMLTVGKMQTACVEVTPSNAQPTAMTSSYNNKQLSPTDTEDSHYLHCSLLKEHTHFKILNKQLITNQELIILNSILSNTSDKSKSFQMPYQT